MLCVCGVRCVGVWGAARGCVVRCVWVCWCGCVHVRVGEGGCVRVCSFFVYYSFVFKFLVVCVLFVFSFLDIFGSFFFFLLFFFVFFKKNQKIKKF